MKFDKNNPFAKAGIFGEILDEFLNTDITKFMGVDLSMSNPRVNVTETAADFTIELAAPGLEKSDFDLNIEEGRLKIVVNKEEEKKEDGEAELKSDRKVLRREFNFNSFTRSFSLPESVNVNAISAKYESGILTITLEKKDENKADFSRKINIS